MSVLKHEKATGQKFGIYEYFSKEIKMYKNVNKILVWLIYLGNQFFIFVMFSLKTEVRMSVKMVCDIHLSGIYKDNLVAFERM